MDTYYCSRAIFFPTFSPCYPSRIWLGKCSPLFIFSGGYGSSPLITLPSDWDMEPVTDASKKKLGTVFKSIGQKFVYIYDFGDDWLHDIMLEDISDKNALFATCLAGKGNCPPEDCGGPWGFEGLKAALLDPKNENHDNMREWLGLEFLEEWDFDYFDLKETNESLRGI